MQLPTAPAWDQLSHGRQRLLGRDFCLHQCLAQPGRPCHSQKPSGHLMSPFPIPEDNGVFVESPLFDNPREPIFLKAWCVCCLRPKMVRAHLIRERKGPHISIWFHGPSAQGIHEQPPRRKAGAVPNARASGHPVSVWSLTGTLSVGDRGPFYPGEGGEKGAVCTGKGGLGPVCTRINQVLLTLSCLCFSIVGTGKSAAGPGHTSQLRRLKLAVLQPPCTGCPQ